MSENRSPNAHLNLLVQRAAERAEVPCREDAAWIAEGDPQAVAPLEPDGRFQEMNCLPLVAVKVCGPIPKARVEIVFVLRYADLVQPRRCIPEDELPKGIGSSFLIEAESNGPN